MPGKQTPCRNGHPESERVVVSGRLRCRACRREHDRRRGKRVRLADRVVCPSGCRGVCLCEDL